MQAGWSNRWVVIHRVYVPQCHTPKHTQTHAHAHSYICTRTRGTAVVMRGDPSCTPIRGSTVPVRYPMCPPSLESLGNTPAKSREPPQKQHRKTKKAERRRSVQLRRPFPKPLARSGHYAARIHPTSRERKRPMSQKHSSSRKTSLRRNQTIDQSNHKRGEE